MYHLATKISLISFQALHTIIYILTNPEQKLKEGIVWLMGVDWDHWLKMTVQIVYAKNMELSVVNDRDLLGHSKIVWHVQNPWSLIKTLQICSQEGVTLLRFLLLPNVYRYSRDIYLLGMPQCGLILVIKFYQWFLGSHSSYLTTEILTMGWSHCSQEEAGFVEATTPCFDLETMTQFPSWNCHNELARAWMHGTCLKTLNGWSL